MIELLALLVRYGVIGVVLGVVIFFILRTLADDRERATGVVMLVALALLIAFVWATTYLENLNNG